MPRFWMVTNRQETGTGWGADEGPLKYWVSDAQPAALKRRNAWTSVRAERFVNELRRVADTFPDLAEADHEKERHVALFVHGFNNSAEDALDRYAQISTAMFERHKLGVCVLFSWPSDGLKVGYYPDRRDARASADELAEVLSTLYDYLVERQAAAMKTGAKTCRAKTSIIAHSMGNYLVQKAMSVVWTRKNQPLLVSMVNQLVMVAADVDNDIFGSGEEIDKSDGDAVANLTYRVTALYSGLDATLGLSAGFKHFGKRRLGRSGLDRTSPPPDNVWDIDCTPFVRAHANTHSAYFDVERTRRLMVAILRGVDRTVLKTTFRLS
jgi:esterase/lipase superfamily enzyme